jgi:Kef-type K+ transport system membrane component KefB
MFRAVKTNGFNLEPTNLQNFDSISKLISVVSIAFVWVYKVGIYLNNKIKKIKIKKHGRRAMSLFKYGLVFVAHALLN